MTFDDVVVRYEELQRYVGWTDADAQCVAGAGALLAPHFQALIDDFYAEIERHPAARRTITGGPVQVERLKLTLLGWLRELVAGRYDADYVARRWRVGGRHVEIGLDQTYTSAALARLRRGLLRIVDEHLPLPDAPAVRRALDTLLDLDLAIIQEAYQAEYLARLASLAEGRRAAEEIARLSADVRQRVAELETLLEVIPIAIGLALDADGRHVRVNPAFARLLGIDPVATTSFSNADVDRLPVQIRRAGRVLFPSEMPLQMAARGNDVRDAELEIVRADGSVVHLLGSAVPLRDDRGRARGSVGAFLDVTENRRAQDEALRTERLAAIGQMVTWLAHESGNALARSLSCLDLLVGEVGDRPQALDLIDRVRRAQEQLRRLYAGLRGYAGPIHLERVACKLSMVWRQAWENLAVARTDRDAALVEQYEGIDLTCSLDPFRLEQVFRNILENSLAACRDPVRIALSCEEAALDGRPAVRLSIRDNGPGLTAEQRQRIFEPFYTTKALGTGLGMAIARRVVEVHGGRMEVGASAAGAEIVVTLPRAAP